MDEMALPRFEVSDLEQVWTLFDSFLFKCLGGCIWSNIWNDIIFNNFVDDLMILDKLTKFIMIIDTGGYDSSFTVSKGA